MYPLTSLHAKMSTVWADSADDKLMSFFFLLVFSPEKKIVDSLLERPKPFFLGKIGNIVNFSFAESSQRVVKVNFEQIAL